MAVTPLTKAPAKITSRETYEALPNMEAVKEAIAGGLLAPADAHAWESIGRQRPTYLEYLDSLSVSDSTPEQGETTPAPPPEASKPKQPPVEPKASKAKQEIIVDNGPKDRDALTKMLLDKSERGAILMEQTERVRNRALPNDPGEIFDWPEEELEYKWVPYFTSDKPLHPLEHQRLRQMIRKGWEFYDNRYFTLSPGANGYPWHPSVDFVESKVLFDGQVLMYRSAKYEARDRQAAILKKRTERERMKEEGVKVSEETGESYTVETRKGETTVDKLLREGKNTVDGDDSFVQRGEAY